MKQDAVIYIVIVNYRRSQDTIDCLKSLRNLTGTTFRVVLIDNGSSDGSVEEIARWLERNIEDTTWAPAPLWKGITYDLKFLAQKNNLGFAGGCNLGLEEAKQDESCSHVWLLNNDTIVERQSLSALKRRFDESPNLGMCGSTLVYFQPADILQGCGGRFSLALGRGSAIGAGLNRYSLPEQSQVENEISYVIGASMLVSVDFVRKVGLMDERYFLYFEELDWALRATRAGFTLGWAKDSVVVHKEGAVIGSSTRGKPSELSAFFMTASYIRLLQANRPMLVPLGLAISGTRIIKWLVSGDIKLAKSVFLGVVDFLKRPSGYRLGSYKNLGQEN